MVTNTTSGCQLQRVVAITTSGCKDHEWQGFLKVGICIDVETWEKERYHLVCVSFKYYIYIFEADPLNKLLENIA